MSTVTMSEGHAVHLIDVMVEVKNALHAHALGSVPLDAKRADDLRHKIERVLSEDPSREKLLAVAEATRGVEFSDQPGAPGAAARLNDALRGLADE